MSPPMTKENRDEKYPWARKLTDEQILRIRRWLLANGEDPDYGGWLTDVEATCKYIGPSTNPESLEDFENVELLEGLEVD
jgi:hypothetical protein